MNDLNRQPSKLIIRKSLSRSRTGTNDPNLNETTGSEELQLLAIHQPCHLFTQSGHRWRPPIQKIWIPQKAASWSTSGLLRSLDNQAKTA